MPNQILTKNAYPLFIINRFKFIFNILSLTITGILILCLSGCDQFTGPSDSKPAVNNKTTKKRPPHAVETEQVKRLAVRIKRTLTGTLEAPRTVHIHSEQPGRIIELPHFEGDRVKQGELLARLDDALLRTSLASKVATRKQAEVDLKRLKKLLPKKLATEDELARAATTLELARAEESRQRTLLSRTVIRAPFDGIISARLKEPSDVVALHEHLLTIFDPTFMSASVQVPEQLHSRVAIGDPLNVHIDSLGDRSFRAKILRIHPVVNALTRQGTIEIHLDPVPANAAPGQLCRVTLETAETPRRLIPLKALQFDSAGSYVYRIDEQSTVQRSAVITGLQISDFIEIIDGIEEGDNIVVKGFLGLKSGKEVKVVTPPGLSSPAGTG